MTDLKPIKRVVGLDDRNFYGFRDTLGDFLRDKLTYGKLQSYNKVKLDIQEKDTEYMIEAELPGIKREEIYIDFTEGKLNISVKKEDKIDEEKNNYIHKERRTSSMRRSLYLDDAKAEGIKAKLDNGILYITVPKEEKAESTHKIPIE